MALTNYVLDQALYEKLRESSDEEVANLVRCYNHTRDIPSPVVNYMAERLKKLSKENEHYKEQYAQQRCDRCGHFERDHAVVSCGTFVPYDIEKERAKDAKQIEKAQRAKTV